MTSTNRHEPKKISAIRIDSGEIVHTQESLAQEFPLQININGEPFSVTMRTPGHDRYLTRGLLHTESLLNDDEAPLEFEEHLDQINHVVQTINVSVPEEFLAREIQGQRALAATSSCGLCGKTRLEDLENIGCPLTIRTDGPFLDPATIPQMMNAMRERQNDFEISGGSHAAALFDESGKLMQLFEDIGRHNAVDKVIGWSLIEKPKTQPSVIVVSGRLSYEIISKAWRGNLPIIVAVSAPSSLAVSAAQRLGITLLGFCRGTRATVYTHSNRIRIGAKKI